ncbi:MAG TPA: hypothetical protein VGM49_01855 [Candidatus Limnocylindrales bacterium]
MIRKRLGRFATIFTAATFALMLVGVGTTFASPPGWEFITPQNLSVQVGPGRQAGWSFTVKNGGTSNISKLYLTDSLAQPALYVQDDRDVCVASPVLFCSFGALAAGASIDVLVVHTAPGSGSFPVTFQLNTSGSTFSDSKNRSHGDTLNLAFDGKTGNPAVTVVNTSSEFDGGYNITAGGTYSTGTTVTKQNPQSSSVVAPINLSAVTIQDSASYSGTGDPCATFGISCIGQWTKLSAPTSTGTPIKVNLVIFSKGIPGSVGPSDIVVYHDGDGIIGDVPSERCASATDSGSAPCIYVTKNGNFQVTIWLLHNGSIRGGF